MNDNRTLTIQNGSTVNISFKTDPVNDWQLTLQNIREEDGEIFADNFLLARKNGKHFFAKLIKTLGINTDGSEFPYWLPRIFDIGNGYKCGDVVIQFRKHPQSKRWMVDIELEYGSKSPDSLEKVFRISRSSLDNVKQAVKKSVKETGQDWTNTQRIGGDKVSMHCVDAGWSPQLFTQGKVMDVFDFVANSHDGPGKTALVEALQHLPTPIAKQVAMCIIIPPTGE
ncbi:MAG: hypothetical protein US68_C0008G0019 [Candidatus Shapirobacteria bacterium GW2011_GWE1_38_10]|uniref:Uncharacterized protein n=1 Tax=Candidatus Shapirobacteria bacterium GW2011_GWE1_38_10 TaxID=1618488 RepID=A0A0G0KLU2_9BACT|nr:MAG: hypothetical protein US46_C0006G0126 [Candidatus Shapirobacteria bacterium GW2011_GWF2_37_20]KKQ50134.1 MAG: hypothetical protein US68_C0008G0019 [Candidatus Shapirobacteria bacterium GW2011_GWE1_38_10]KKQ63929.1 MAG: hypothetical protein US85_C0013G0003 [Candidatus Shapirobacteria bacterium GW2011_GWF1_38_23]HBP51466.1 hypothetical protein [Candidatus Shapirobacteria bacterium]